jgi:hypothetical protein
VEAVLGALEEDVLGLEVPVDDALAMGVGDAGGCLEQQGEEEPQVGLSVEQLAEGAAIEELEDDVTKGPQDQEGMAPDDRRVGHLEEDPDLADKAVRAALVPDEFFERDGCLGDEVSREEHPAVGPLADDALDQVALGEVLTRDRSSQERRVA